MGTEESLRAALQELVDAKQAHMDACVALGAAFPSAAVTDPEYWRDRTATENELRAHHIATIDAAVIRLDAAWAAAANALSAHPARASQEPEPPTETYVQPVPDKCDRIVWRNRYYSLPLGEKEQQNKELSFMTREQIANLIDAAVAADRAARPESVDARYTTEQAIAIAQASVTYGKSQRDAARMFGISEGYLSDMLNGRREPDKLLELVGFVKEVRWQRIRDAAIAKGSQDEHR